MTQASVEAGQDEVIDLNDVSVSGIEAQIVKDGMVRAAREVFVEVATGLRLGGLTRSYAGGVRVVRRVVSHDWTMTGTIGQIMARTPALSSPAKPISDSVHSSASLRATKPGERADPGFAAEHYPGLALLQTAHA